METTEPRSANEGPDSTPETGVEKARGKKPRGFWPRARKVAVLLLFIFVFLGLAGLLFIQLPIFKRIVVSQLASAIEQSTNGTLVVGEVQGNLLEGFVMSNVTLHLKTGTAYDSIPLIHVDRILARYSLFRLLRTNEIEISSLILQHPVIRFVKFAGDTTWNYDLLTKPSAPDEHPKPFSQIVDLASFEIQNGSFYMRDYNHSPSQPEAMVAPKRGHPVAAQTGEPAIDWADVEVEGLDMSGQFYAHGSSMQSARVNHLQFTEKKSGFFVEHLQCSASLDSTEARLTDAKITTEFSDLGFSIEVAQPKILKTGLLTSLQHSPVKATINGAVINTGELKQFFPRALDFLAGAPGINLVTTGEFGKLHIQKLALNFRDRGAIAISGELGNLHNPDSLTMDLVLQARNLSNATLDDYVPGLHVPDLSRFGNINIPSLTYTGAPLNFHTKFNAMSSGAGGAAGDVTLDLRRKQFEYRAGLKTTNFNLAALAHNPDFESSITAETKVSGRGTNWKTMAATITAKTDASSTFEKYHVASLDLAGAMQSGTMTADHLDAVVEGGPEIHVRSAMAELASPTIPFRFDGAIKNFLLAQAIRSESKNPARVDLDAKLTGSAKDFEDVTGTARIRLFNLEYQGHALPEDTADITISAARPGEDSLTLRSSIADLTIDRRFQTGDLIHAVPDHVNALLTAIENREFPQQVEIAPPMMTCVDSMDFDYRLQIKDLRPLADFLPRTFLLAQGIISGGVSGCKNGNLNLNVNGDSVAFILRDRPSIDSNLVETEDSNTEAMDTSRHAEDSSIVAHSIHRTAIKRVTHRDSTTLALPHFGAGTPRIQLMPANFRLALRNLSNDPKTVLDHLHAQLDFGTDSLIRLGSALLYYPKVDLVYKNQALDFNVSSIYNNALGIHVKGDVHFPNGDFDFALDTMEFTYENPYFTPTSGSLRQFIWRNEGISHILLAKNGLLKIDTLNIIHPTHADTADHSNAGMQRVSIGGTLSGDTVNAWANFPSFRLEDLRRILPFNPNAKTFDFSKYRGKVRDFQATLAGTLERPDIGARLFVDSMTYAGDEDNKITFDSNYVNLTYRDQELRGSMDIHVANVIANVPNGLNLDNLKGSELRATIDSIPMVIAFERGPSYAADSARAATLPLSASIHTTQFPLEVVTPFLPPFRQIDGTGDINFTVNGTREHIEYAGQASIQNGEFLLAATNMWYLARGPLTFAHNALTLQNDSINNIQSDDPSGAASLSGSFTFNGFDITNFDLRLRTNRLMVLSNAAKESLPVAYGPVTINTGGEDFHFFNTFEEPKIAGTINIMSANVTMPQSNGPAQSVSGEGVIYETLPRDSMPIALRSDTTHGTVRQIYAVRAGSVHMSPIDDTLFPNRMKNIYLDDEGRADSSLSVVETSHASPLAPSFTDKLRMDLRINTQGDATITIPLGGAFGILRTQLMADLKSGGTLQIERGDDLITQANGGFELSSNSTFSFLQTFNITKGTISFIHDFGNPSIDVEAEYTHPLGSNPSQQARVTLDITGTKDHPNLTVYNYNQPTPGGEFELRPEPSPEVAEEDAIYFLGTGSFKGENTNTNPSAIGTLLPDLTGQLAGDVIANLFGSTSSQFAIRSAALNVGTRGAQVTAAYREITLKLGSGYSYSGPNGALGNYGVNIETDIPLSTLSSSALARYFLMEVQINPNPTSATAGSLTQQPIFLTTLLYTGITF